MKQFVFSLLLVGSVLVGIVQPSARAGTTDYALTSATPYNSEIALGRERLEKFLYSANAKKKSLLTQTPIVAVPLSTNQIVLFGGAGLLQELLVDPVANAPDSTATDRFSSLVADRFSVPPRSCHGKLELDHHAPHPASTERRERC